MKKHWFILLIPYVWDVLLIPYANQVQLRPFGIPFLLLWMMAGIIVTSICIAIVFSMDRKLERRSADERRLHAPES